MPTAAPAAVSETTSTLTPFYGAAYYTEVGEAKRQALNAWIRTSKAYDAVIDFDKVTRDPENPKSDHLHPNDAGYKARETHEPWANRRTEGKFHERRTNKAGDKLSESDAQVALSLGWKTGMRSLELFRELATAKGAASAAPSSRFERLFQ
jgi:hypothetical protein